MNDALDREIARLTSALCWHRAVVGAGWGLVGALTMILAAILVARMTPWLYQTELLLAAIWAVGGGMLVGAVGGYVWPCPLPQRLRCFDLRLHLANRLTTAWELAQGHICAPEALVRLQRAETLEVLRTVDPRVAFPARLPRSAGVLAFVALLGLVPALLIANPQEAQLDRLALQQQATEAAIAKSGIHFLVPQILPALPQFIQCLLDRILKAEVNDIVSHRPSHEELERQIIHTFDLIVMVRLLGFDPTLNQTIADGI